MKTFYTFLPNIYLFKSKYFICDFNALNLQTAWRASGRGWRKLETSFFLDYNEVLRTRNYYGIPG